MPCALGFGLNELRAYGGGGGVWYSSPPEFSHLEYFVYAFFHLQRTSKVVTHEGICIEESKRLRRHCISVYTHAVKRGWGTAK
jgi:hypothetical protein